MILLDLKRYIQEHEQVSMENIIHHFDLSEEMANDMLNRLIAQGQIQRIETGEGGCATGKCSTHCTQNQPADRFQWLPRKFKPLKLI